MDEKQIIKIKYKNNFYTFKTNLIGKIQIKNILMAMIAAEKSNIDFKSIVNVINKINPVSGRLEKIGRIRNNSKVILDYAHTPDALKTCLQSLKAQYNTKKNSAVILLCTIDNLFQDFKIDGAVLEMYQNLFLGRVKKFYEMNNIT